MGTHRGHSYRVAVTEWSEGDGIARAICDDLASLGHSPTLFRPEDDIPGEPDIVLIYGPYGRYLHVLDAVSKMPFGRRPAVVLWNTEGLPNPGLPWTFMKTLAVCRSWVHKMPHSKFSLVRHMASKMPFSYLEKRLNRFHYLGDWLLARKQRCVRVFAMTSLLYADLLARHGFRCVFAPFGGVPNWYADLGLERDIDVLWIGRRATKRRSRLLDDVRERLSRLGVSMHVVDGVENANVFGKERTKLFNRAKITLNLLRTAYDENTLRVCLAAGNRSLVVSEPILRHVPRYAKGIHFVQAHVQDLPKTILYYLKNATERESIANNAHRLIATELTLGRSLAAIVGAASRSGTCSSSVPAVEMA